MSNVFSYLMLYFSLYKWMNENQMVTMLVHLTKPVSKDWKRCYLKVNTSLSSLWGVTSRRAQAETILFCPVRWCWSLPVNWALYQRSHALVLLRHLCPRQNQEIPFATSVGPPDSPNWVSSPLHNEGATPLLLVGGHLLVPEEESSTSKMFTFSKLNWEVRCILDPKSLNPFLKVTKFWMESARSVIATLQMGELLSSIDIKDV